MNKVADRKVGNEKLNSHSGFPEYVRLPKPGSRCPYTGLSRGTLNELVLPCDSNDRKPPVHSVVLKKRNAIRGIRLVNYRSLMEYLETLTNN